MPTQCQDLTTASRIWHFGLPKWTHLVQILDAVVTLDVRTSLDTLGGVLGAVGAVLGAAGDVLGAAGGVL